jgi:predicted MPP superfamily phosphohydrolase
VSILGRQGLLRLIWLSDIHLDAVKNSYGLRELCERIVRSKPDLIVISGDIAEAHTHRDRLKQIVELCGVPVYYVHGNHDFYGGSIIQTRQEAVEFMRTNPLINWLPAAGVVELTPTTCMIGHDGWADGRNGDYWNSRINMRDFQYIREIPATDKERRLRVMKSLAEETNQYLRKKLPEALTCYDHIIFVTHVPPFEEASWHRGKRSDKHFLPYYSSKTVGDTIVKYMKPNPGKTMTVLCGHTHGRGRYQPLPNIMVKTAGSEYGAPNIQDVMEIVK